MLFRKFMKPLIVGLLTSACLVWTLLAQDHTVSSDASAALRAEWLDLGDHGGYSGLMRCLRALDEYTLPGNPDTALKELALNGTFSQADAAIAHLYDSKPEELDSGVNKVAAKSQSRALYNLLRLVADSAWLEKYLQPVGAAADSAASNAAQTMDLFRTCYRFDRNRLFRLVSKHFR
jgi:hypothetical protein